MDSTMSSRSLQMQQSQRPQSLLVPQIAIPLQRLQHPFPVYEQPTNKIPAVQQQNRQYSPQPSHFGANQQNLSSSRSGRSSPHPHAANPATEKRPQKQQHPQIWCGKGQIEPTASKHVYNYSHWKDSTEKTPMCRIAELARYNKLRHEYVLLDESGPAHKKKFTVKLVLCHGQEFEGSGPSIKKAQQSAAQFALDSTTLSKPPQMRGVRRQGKKDEPSNPILLLNTVSAQMGINVQYREEMIGGGTSPSTPAKPMPNFSLLPGFPPPPNPLPQLFYAPPPTALFTHPQIQAAHQISPNKRLTSILDLTMAPPINGGFAGPSPTLPPPFPFSPFQQIMENHVNGFSLLPACLSLPINPLLLPPGCSQSTANLPKPQMELNSHPMPNVSYKVTITLSLDGSEHSATASNLPMAKQKAATLALAHLKPELEQFKRNAENTTNGQQFPQEEENKTEQSLELNNAQNNSSIESESPLSTPESGKEEEENNEANEIENCPQNEAIQQQQEGRPRPRRKTKSVVSQIHECALRLRMNIEFEVLAETGEPHNRVYTLRCRLSTPSSGLGSSSGAAKEYVAEGQGPSKKAAKQAACQQLLEQVCRLVDNDPIQLATQIIRQTGANGSNHQQRGHRGGGNGGPSSNNQKEVGGGNGKRKTIIKDKKMDPAYGHHINPISRLIQVMQVRQEREPVFQLIAEQGQNRHKEFVVLVKCMDLEKEGTGPNKKLAKRAAAEAMLALIGYVKPMPQPGKSLLKKRAEQNDGGMEFMEIGLFDVNEAAMGENGSKKEGKGQRKAANGDSLETFADVEQALREEVEEKEEQADVVEKDPSNSPPCPMSAEHSPENEDSSSFLASPSPPQESGGPDGSMMPAIRSQRRRVTFSEQVSACPPPEDSTYPSASIAPLKSDLGGRLKRRSRDSQRILNAEEQKKLTGMAKRFLEWPDSENEKRGFVELEAKEEWANGLVEWVKNEAEPNEANASQTSILVPPPTSLLSALPFAPLKSTVLTNSFVLPPIPPLPLIPPVTATAIPNSHHLLPNFAASIPSGGGTNVNSDGKLALMGARQFLDHLAKQFKFSVAYSDFPKTKNSTDEEQCFTLLTLGLAKPIVCHGSGSTESDAHNDAAFNAIRNSLSQLN